MYVNGSLRSRAIPLLSLVAFAIFSVPLCGTWSQPQRNLKPVVSSSIPTRIKGIGLNCHMEELPVNDIKALGIQWVRVDSGGRGIHADQIRHIIDHYRDFGILWIVTNDNHDPVEEARVVSSLGITDIEVLNEPDYIPVTPTAYVKLFRQIRSVVGNKVRLYGPATGKWLAGKPYLDAILDQGLQMDVISFHCYLRYSERIENMAAWVAEAKTYGLPVVVSEVGYPTTDNYRAKFTDTYSLGSLFVRTKRALEGATWCWYDGPNPSDNGDAGMFDFRGGKYVPNHNYRAIKAALDQERQN